MVVIFVMLPALMYMFWRAMTNGGYSLTDERQNLRPRTEEERQEDLEDE